MDGTATASRTSPRARRLTFARRVCVLVSLLLITPPFHGVAAAVLLVGPLVLAPAGDRVVVVERNVLLAGYGDVYLIPGGFGVGRKIAGYSADDGYSPMGNGAYALEWRGSEPHFTAYGTPANPVVMCPAD